MKKIVLLIALIVTGLVASSVEYAEVYKTYKSGNFQKAMQEFKILAEGNNDSDAAYILGYMFEHGEGCNVDKAESIKWYKISVNGYYQKSKMRVDKDVHENKNIFIENLSEIEDPQTNKTIYQHLQSVVNIKAHKTNYLLPVSMRTNGDYDDNNPNGRDTDSKEIEFQISVKYDFAPNFFGFNELYSVGYTQHSFWQYFVGDAYFRASDYNPEFFVTFPISTEYLKAIRFSVAHQSNGLGEPGERAWNYATFSTFFQYKTLFTELQVWHRFKDNHDYNPGLIDTMGHGHIKFTLPYKKHMVTALFRNNFKGKGAIDADYSYPLFGDSLFLYLKAFAGYGESMITYAGSHPQTSHEDDYVERIGIGFGLSR
ncbi:MAG: phospholipase A [Sulfurimonas sp.]|nr:phospholipase A [Sulfurimonas sp.]